METKKEKPFHQSLGAIASYYLKPKKQNCPLKTNRKGEKNFPTLKFWAQFFASAAAMSNSKTDMSEASSLTLENLGAELSIKLSLIKKNHMCEAMMLYLIAYKYQEVTSFHSATRFGVNLSKCAFFSERRSQ